MMAETKRSPIQRPNTAAKEREQVNQTTEPHDAGSLPPPNSIEESNLGSGGPTHDEIAARAYQCWQERGGGHGASEDDWYRAEQELRAEHARAGHQSRSAASSA